MAKLVTDTLLKKSVEDVLTELVNSTFDWQEYTDEEIGQIIELDPTQVAELSAVINDSVAATNKVYSSQHTKELIQESLIEANKYSDDLVANLSNIKLDIVDSLPDSSTVNKSTIYILKDSSGGTNNTLNVWSDTTSAFVEVGKLSVNMDNYYTKAEVDAELVKKANDDEVLKSDAIVTDLTTTSGSTTLSTVGLQTELDKKANDDEVVKKTEIVTTIDKSSTDDKIPTAKAIYNNPKNKILQLSTGTDILEYADSVGSELVTITVKLVNGVNCPYGASVNSSDFYYTIYNINHEDYKRIVAYDIRKNDMYMIMKHVTWGAWRKVCTTSVADVPVTTLTVNSWASGTITYCVRNGVCFVHVTALISDTMSTIDQVLASGLPKPLFADKWYVVASNAPTQGSLLIHLSGNGNLTNHVGINNSYYFGSFSYVVAES